MPFTSSRPAALGPRWLLYCGALLVFAMALAVRLLILPIEARLGFLTFYPATVLGFYYLGKWPGRLVMLLCAVTVYYVFTPPQWSWTPSRDGFWSVLVFIAFSEWVRTLIDRSKDSQAALHRQKRQFEAIVQDQSDVICRFRADGTVLFVNDAFCRMFGVNSGDIVGRHWAPVVYPEDMQHVTDGLARLSPSNPVVTIENRVFGEAGVLRWGQFANRGFFDAHGQLVEVQCVGRDISQQKALQVQLDTATRELQDLYDNAPCGYYSLDAAGTFVRANATALAWFGCSSDELIGKKRLVDFFTSEGQAQFHRNFEQFKREGQLAELEFDLVPLHGPVRRVSMTATAVKDDQGCFLMSRSVMFDITERGAAEESLRALAAIFDNTSDFVIQTDRRGKLNYMNPALRAAMGMTADAPIAHLGFANLYSATSVRLYTDVVEPKLRAGASVWLGEATIHVANRHEVSVSQIVIAHRDIAGQIERISVVLRDISADVESRQQIARQTATLRSVTEAIPSTVAVVGPDGHYRFANGAFARRHETTSEEVVGRQVMDVIGQEEFDRRWPWVQLALEGTPTQFILDYPSREGTTYIDISHVPLRLDTGEFDGFVVVTNDVTYQKREEGRLRQLAHQDPLTGILNRAGFESYLDRAIQAGSGASLALLYIDLDHFKPVNDHHGHPAGDEVLRIFANRLVNLVRPTDAVARLGGDEFAIALSGVKERANAHVVAEKVLAAAQAPFNIGPALVQINASVGVAFEASPDRGWPDLVARADTQLLVAKAEGKGRLAGER
ncbi:MAG: PAS domain S-box protein [Burkholderiaceae bacterium]|nr:PAS domain S-box protein [Burkholderiaceae bacterium]